MEITQDWIDRFNLKWKEMDNGCHEWIGAHLPKGYGIIKIPKTRRQEYAHRLSYMISVGEITDGKNVCHTCDNPKCVNPKHLFLGNQKDNLQDMRQKGRHLYGENNTQSVLTDMSVTKIKEMLRDGRSQGKIAAFYGVSRATISKINRGIRWAHIK